MISFPIDILFQRIIHTLEKDIIPLLGSPFSRTQATGIISLLSNIAPRLEHRCDLLRQETEENRDILKDILVAIREEKKASQNERITQLEDQLIKVFAPAAEILAEENKRLLRILVDTIRSLDSLETILPPSLYISLKDKIKGHLRRQLKREMAFLTSTKFGRMSSA